MTSKTLSIALLLFLSIKGLAQGYTKEIKQQFVDAEYFLMSENYEKALQLYKTVNQFDPENYNVIYRIGLCYLNLPFQVKESIPFLEKAVTNINPKYNEGSYKEIKADPDALYYLGVAYQHQYRFDDAIQTFTKYKNLLDVKKLYFINQVDRQIAACKFSQEILKAPATVAYKKLDPIINTNKQSNFNPCLSGDDSVLIYSRSIPHKAYDKVMDMQIIKVHNRIMMCRRNATGWGAPVDISTQVKSEGSAIPISLAPDGKTLYLFRDNNKNGGAKDKDRGTMYVSYFAKNKWSAMLKLPGYVNTLYNETHASMSSDAHTLYFTSDKKDGSYGGIDIYTTEKINDSTWSAPQNLGETINTPYNEEAPFILNDNLLFFSSQGHNTMGGYDLFFSHKTASGWTQPVNMRPPINTPDDDLFFVPVLNGSRAYHALEVRDSSGQTLSNKEIYSFEISLDDLDKTTMSASPVISANVNPRRDATHQQNSQKTVPVIGLLQTSDNKALKTVKISIYNANSKQAIANLTPNYQTNTYKTDLPAGSYLLVVEGEQYSRSEQVIYVSNSQPASVMISTILTPNDVASGKYFMVKTLFFEGSATQLSRDNQIELERVFALLQENPSLNVELVTHAQTKNSNIAKQLSDSISAYLQKRGIEQQRIASSSENTANGTSQTAAEIKLVRTDTMQIISENISLPDEVAYKDFIRYSILVSRQDKELTQKELDIYKESGLPKLEVLQVQNQYIYYSGDCKNKADAVILLNKIQEAGFASAEITDYFKTNRLTSIQTPTATVTTSRAKKHAVDDDDDMSVSDDLGQANTAPSQWYTIQLCSLNAPDDKMKKDEKVLVYHCKDGLYRYIWGLYTSIDEAKIDLPKALQWGFSDAFVAQGSRYNELECECNR